MSGARELDLALTVNGRAVAARVPSTLRLLHFLRDELRLTGAKDVCGEGECGACTVLMDGRPVCSCLILAAEAQGTAITTIEGVSHPVIGALEKTHAVQCGYCFPGMVLSAVALLDAEPDPDREQIKQGLAGNLCRCTGYAKIIDAVGLAAAEIAAKIEEKKR